MSERRLTYTFGPLERRGMLGPIDAGQAALVALSGVVAVAAIDLVTSAAGAFAATAIVAGALTLSFAPVGGRTAEEWLPIALSFAVRRAPGRRAWRSPIAVLGGRLSASGTRDPEAVAPPALCGATLQATEYRGREIGLVTERAGRRMTSVIACRVTAFSLLDQDAQERRLARWGLVLSGSNGSAIRRLQWVERTAPAQGDEMARWLHEERDPAVPLRGTAMVESYLELISDSARVTQDHEILLAIQVDAARVRDRGTNAVLGALLEQTERVARGLEAAEVTVLGALTPGQLARALRTAFDPFARAELAALEGADAERDGLSAVNAWPLGAREGWDHYESDGAVHATYWIGGWPRSQVSPAFMSALLGGGSVVRAVAVTFEPLPADRSTREVEAAITRDQADRELRVRFGQSETARQRQAAEAARRRESELASGHAEVRFSGFVTVSARDRDELRRACAEINGLAARARLELHRLYGQQAEAFTFTLPLGRGLR